MSSRKKHDLQYLAHQIECHFVPHVNLIEVQNDKEVFLSFPNGIKYHLTNIGDEDYSARMEFILKEIMGREKSITRKESTMQRILARFFPQPLK